MQQIHNVLQNACDGLPLNTGEIAISSCKGLIVNTVTLLLIVLVLPHPAAADEQAREALETTARHKVSQDLRAGTEAGTASAPDDCAAPFDPFDVFKPEAATRESVTSLALYRCNGGLHLVDLARARVFTRINPRWWLDSYDSSAWNEAGDELTVNAQFITGIGPTGVIPFPVRYVVRKDDAGRWRSVQIPPEAQDYVVTDDGMVEITRPEQLAALALRERGQPVEVDVDFSQSRLIVKSVWLTSGSMQIKDVAVARTERAYFVTYDIDSPRIGTADMKQSVIYLVLPKDVRYVSFAAPEFGARRFTAAQVGVIDRGGFNKAPSL